MTDSSAQGTKILLIVLISICSTLIFQALRFNSCIEEFKQKDGVCFRCSDNGFVYVKESDSYYMDVNIYPFSKRVHKSKDGYWHDGLKFFKPKKLR